MTIGTSTYLITKLPSSSVLSCSNVHPPPYSHGPLSRYMATSQVCTAVTRLVVSQVHILSAASGGYVHASRGPPATSRVYIPTPGVYISTYGVSHGASHVMTYGPYYGTQYGQVSSSYGGGYQQPTYSLNYGFVAPHSQGTPHCGAYVPPYMGQTGGGYYGHGHVGYGHQSYVNQNYQGAPLRPAQARLPFLATLNLLDLSRLTNDPVSYDLAWPAVPNKLPLDIPKF